MPFDSVRDSRFRPSVIILVAVVIVCTSMASEVKGEKVRVPLRVCVQSEAGTVLPNASVILSADGKQFKIEAERHGGCVTEPITFDKDKAYKLRVTAIGYEDTDQDLAVSDINNDRMVEVSAKLRPKQLTGGSPGGQNQNAAQPPATGANSPSGGGTPGEGGGVSPGNSGGVFDPVFRVGSFLWEHWGLSTLLVLIILTLIAWRTDRIPSFAIGSGRDRSDDPVALVNLPMNSSVIQDLKQIKAQQQQTNAILIEIRDTLNKGVHIASGEIQPRSQPDVMASVPRVATEWQSHRPGQAGIVTPSFEELVLSYYRSLVRGNAMPADLEITYLIAEQKSSSEDALKESDIYLQEVSNSQGTFILFSDSKRNGYVFPNPGLLFKPALRTVFPDLTEDSFTRLKEEIKPVRVGQVTDTRWRVES